MQVEVSEIPVGIEDAIVVARCSRRAPHDAEARDPVRAGYGKCRACGCKGYSPKGGGYCHCGHNFTQHW